jgi:hypothetical protein
MFKNQKSRHRTGEKIDNFSQIIKYGLTHGFI